MLSAVKEEIAFIMSDKPTKKERRWLLPDSRKALKPGLYIIATPVGNLGDITLRALDTLEAVDLVLCEDTRVSGKLMAHFGLDKTLWSYNDHNAAQQRGPILAKLQAGESVALISDAGTPLVSDPGYKLVRECIAAGIYVTALPGANAPLTALQLSGLPTDQFCFIGFLPSKSTARRKMLQSWKDVQGPLVAFETAPRLQDALKDILEALGDRKIAVARELTKMYEETRRGLVSDLIAEYKSSGDPKGEIVLVIASGKIPELSEAEICAMLEEAMQTLSTSDAAAMLAKETGWPRKKIYELALKMKSE